MNAVNVINDSLPSLFPQFCYKILKTCRAPENLWFIENLAGFKFCSYIRVRVWWLKARLVLLQNMHP